MIGNSRACTAEQSSLYKKEVSISINIPTLVEANKAAHLFEPWSVSSGIAIVGDRKQLWLLSRFGFKSG